MRARYLMFSKDELQDMLNSSSTLTDFGEKLGYSRKGNSGIAAAKKCIAKFGLDCSHIRSIRNMKNGKNANYGRIDMNKFKKRSSCEKKPKRQSIRANLINIRGNRCENCGLEEWLGKPIPLQLHHKDGDGWNNELANLELLCPNCHAMTDNWCGRHSKCNGNKVSDDEVCYAIKHSHSIREAAMMLGLADTVGTFYNRCYKLMAIRGISLLDK